MSMEDRDNNLYVYIIIMYMYVNLATGSHMQHSMLDVCTVCAKKNLPCTVRFTLDRLMKTEVKRLLNGPRSDAERTVHGPFRFTYAYYTRVTIKFYACTMHVSVVDFE